MGRESLTGVILLISPQEAKFFPTGSERVYPELWRKRYCDVFFGVNGY